MTAITIEFNRQQLKELGEEIVSMLKLMDGGFRLKESDGECVRPFMQQIIISLRQEGRERTSETYQSALTSFCNFAEQRDVPLRDMDVALMERYEAYLKGCGLTLNTVSFYMRILRAVYNRAVDSELIEDRHPFRHVYTGIEKTQKKAVSASYLSSLKSLPLENKAEKFARDMFLFSFYTRGMSFVDMAYLKKSDLQHGVLSYKRRKTGQRLRIKWEECMQEIVDNNPADGEYLLPIIEDNGVAERRQYKAKQLRVNNRLKTIAAQLAPSCNLTMYVARHSWASLAKDKNVPIGVISECLGHTSEKTTQIYMCSIDAEKLDEANALILNSL